MMTPDIQIRAKKLFTFIAEPSLDQISQRSRELKNCDAARERFPTAAQQAQIDAWVLAGMSAQELEARIDRMMGY